MKNVLMVFIVCAGVFGGYRGLAQDAVQNTNPGGNKQQVTLRVETLKDPIHLYLHRGQSVQFGGPSDELGLSRTISLESGGIVLARQTFAPAKRWQLSWQPPTGSRTHYYIYINQALSGRSSSPVAHLTLDVLDKPAFSIIPGASSPTNGQFPIKIEASDKIPADTYEFMLDDAPIDLKMDHGTSNVDVHALPPGTHTLGAIAHLADGSQYVVDTVALEIEAMIRLLPLKTGDSLDLAGAPETVPLAVQIDPSISPMAVEFFDGAKRIGRSDKPPFNDVMLVTNGLRGGVHHLHCEAIAPDKQHYVSPELIIKVKSVAVHPVKPLPASQSHVYIRGKGDPRDARISITRPSFSAYYDKPGVAHVRFEGMVGVTNSGPAMLHKLRFYIEVDDIRYEMPVIDASDAATSKPVPQPTDNLAPQQMRYFHLANGYEVPLVDLQGHDAVMMLVVECETDDPAINLKASTRFTVGQIEYRNPRL